MSYQRNGRGGDGIDVCWYGEHSEIYSTGSMGG